MPENKVILAAESVFGKSQKLGLEYVLKVNPDRLLSTSFTAMGKVPKAEPYGGWESPVYGSWGEKTLRGHSLGHYLSALSGFYAATGDVRVKEKLDYTVNEINSLQREDGFFDAIPSTPFDEVFSSGGNFNAGRFDLNGWWVPWYAIHKIYAGLLDAFLQGKNSLALQVVVKLADWAVRGLEKLNEQQFQKMLNCEHGGMCKVFADLYEITGEKKYLELAQRFIHQEIYKPLSEEKDLLQGYHANTQMPKIIGLAKLYDLTGNEAYRRAVEFFFKTVSCHRSYVIGGNSIGEHFGPAGEEKLGRDTCETCNTYNMMEIAEYVFKWNCNPEGMPNAAAINAADFYERALYNHILASQDPVTGAKTYFVSQLPGFFKVYGTFDDSWWCCTGTGMENPERYGRFIATFRDDTIFVNLFISSIIYTDDGWKVQIETAFPYQQSAKIKVLETGKPGKTLVVRVPGWSGDSSNFFACELDQGFETYVNLPMKLHCRLPSAHSKTFNILYGPLVLAAQLSKKEMPADIVANQLEYMTHKAVAVSAVTGDVSCPEEWIRLCDSEKLIFKIDGGAVESGEEYELRPFFDTHHVRYATYFSDAAEADGGDCNGGAGDENRFGRGREVVDFIEAGRQQSEVEHEFAGGSGNGGSGNGECGECGGCGVETEAKVDGAGAADAAGGYGETGYFAEVDGSYRIPGKGGISYRMKLKGSGSGAGKSSVFVTVYGKACGVLSVCFAGKEIGTVTADGTAGEKRVDYEIQLPEWALKAAADSETFYGSVKLAGNLPVLELRSVYG